jgi:hypothetical protein
VLLQKEESRCSERAIKERIGVKKVKACLTKGSGRVSLDLRKRVVLLEIEDRGVRVNDHLKTCSKNVSARVSSARFSARSRDREGGGAPERAGLTS